MTTKITDYFRKSTSTDNRHSPFEKPGNNFNNPKDINEQNELNELSSYLENIKTDSSSSEDVWNYFVSSEESLKLSTSSDISNNTLNYLRSSDNDYNDYNYDNHNYGYDYNYDNSDNYDHDDNNYENYFDNYFDDFDNFDNGLPNYHSDNNYDYSEIYSNYYSQLSEDGTLLRKIPKNKQTRSMCILAINNWGGALQYVRDDLINEHMCVRAVKNCGWALEFVPKREMTKEICISSVEQNGLAFRYVDTGLLNANDVFEIYNIALEQNKSLPKYLKHCNYKFNSPDFEVSDESYFMDKN